MKKGIYRLYTFLVYLFLYAPIIVLIVYSFNESSSRGKWGGFSLKWYAKLFDNPTIMTSLKNTLLIALLSAIIATVIGTLAAIGIHKLKPFSKSLVMDITYLPVLNPDIVTGISLMLLFVFLSIPLGFTSLLLSHITFNIPYVILNVMPKLKQLNPNTYEAALDLGAHPLYAYSKVILPEIAPGILTGFLFALTLSIDDFVVSFFTTGPGVSTLSITIYSMTRKGIKPEINALSALMFVTVLILLFIVNYRSDDNKKENSNEEII
ncbi:MAG: ABC transporter permease [Clostridia bacterium]|nr:ABC transporter permease [Clostridia bacterium]